MTDEKQARVTAFSKEQGFGRVTVADEGELVFDATVAACSVDDLVPGAEVRVETGPGRIAGQRKVTRLWRAGSPPPEAEAPSAADRFANLGPYRLLLPPFWPEDSVTERGSVWSSVAKLNDVACVLLVFVGGAAEEKTKADLVATRGNGRRSIRCDARAVGVAFEGHRFEDGGEAELLYVLAAHGDLLTAGCCFAANNPEAERSARLLLTMVGAAVLRRGPPAPSPAPTKGSGAGFWKRLFGG